MVVQYKSTCRNAVVQVANTFQQHIRMNHFSVVNLAILGAVVLLHFGVQVDCSSSCSFPGLPGRDGILGQQGRDGRDGSHGPVGPPGSQLGIHSFCMYTYVRM